MKLILFADGSCHNGIGGWGASLISITHHKRLDIYGGEHNTTSNRMELKAVILPLELFQNAHSIKVFTDSLYVYKGSSIWINKWQQNQFRHKNNLRVNSDLWMRIVELKKNHIINWNWVASHSGITANEHVDALANKARIWYSNNPDAQPGIIDKQEYSCDSSYIEQLKTTHLKGEN